MRIPLSAPDISEDDIQAVVDVLRTSRLSMGPKLGEFERAIADYVGAENAIAVNSGTSGLHLCLRALGIGEGDEVIVPSFAFIAVANAILQERATPVFVDIEPDTLNLNPSLIEQAITPRTKAILVVHTFGCPADMSSILEIARRHHLLLIEDACEAFGAEYDAQKVGVLGDVGVFAFYPNKQITTGEGGVIVTQDSRTANLIRKLRNQGRDETNEWFSFSEIGFNYRLSDINCALGIGQVRKIETILARREEVAKAYSGTLGACPEITLPPLTVSRSKISWFVYVIRFGLGISLHQRDWIVEELNRRGIGAGRYFAPIHLQPAYQRLRLQKVSLPLTESISGRTLALPFFNRIQPEQIEEVCKNLMELSRLTAGAESEIPTKRKIHFAG
ncbi:MAG: DegT/DnrJ/EryC1/StrS family aminotransferase [Candidatus Acidiferrales bacterium]